MKQSAEQMDECYGQWVDYVLVKEDPVGALAELQVVLERVQMEPQWVPVSWVRSQPAHLSSTGSSWISGPYSGQINCSSECWSDPVFTAILTIPQIQIRDSWLSQVSIKRISAMTESCFFISLNIKQAFPFQILQCKMTYCISNLYNGSVTALTRRQYMHEGQSS